MDNPSANPPPTRTQRRTEDMRRRIIQTAATGGTGHGVSPAAVDKIFAPGVTATDDKDIYFATAGDAVGNGFRLVSDGVDGWHLIFQNGTISQEA